MGIPALLRQNGILAWQKRIRGFRQPKADEMKPPPFKAVAMIADSAQRYFLIDFARLLKEQCGCSVHFYSKWPGGLEFFERFAPAGTFDTLNVVEPQGTAIPAIEDDGALLERAAFYEARYGRTINWFTVNDRHKGRGYAPGGFYHPRSRHSERMSHGNVVDSVVRQFDFWEGEIISKKIDLILNAGFIEAAVARSNGIASSTPTSSRLENLYYWTTTETGYGDQIEAAYCQARSTAGAPAAACPPHHTGIYLAMCNSNTRVGTLARRIVRKLVRYAYWRYKRSEKSKQYYVLSEIALFYRQWRDLRLVTGPTMARIADLEERRFVFYALQVEPEALFQGRSPEYFYQLPAIISLSRDLPADVFLAVKEHTPAAGRRPNRFYDQIRELKNVVMVNAFEPGQELVRRAVAVATINGTVGQEAAVIGKPVVTFGRHNLYNILPHVQVVTDEAELGPALKRALSDDFDRETAIRDGLRFLAALRAISFSMKDFSFANPRGYDADALQAAYEKLMESVRGRMPTVTVSQRSVV